MDIQKKAYQNTLNFFETDLAIRKSSFESQKEDIYNTCPKLREIDRKITSVMVDYTKSLISKGKSKKQEDVKNEINKLKEDRKALLEILNLPNDFLSFKYNCKKCSDLGFIGNEMCTCFKKAYTKELLKIQSYALKTQKSNFDKFNLKYYTDEEKAYMTKVKSAALIFSSEFDKQEKGLLFTGRTGLGKSLLAECIANSLIAQGKNVVFDLCQNIMQQMEKEHFNRDIKEGYIENVYNCDLLILDDLGSEFKTQFSKAMIYNILNTRERSGKLIIVTTNLDINSFEKEYDERIKSRLLGNLDTLNFVGTDIRGKL